MAREIHNVKPRWSKPSWIIFILIATISLSLVSFVGVQTWLRYGDPRLDVTSSNFEKTVTPKTVSVGDVVEVKVIVYWHGYVMPEFKRDVRIIDSFQEGDFALVGGSNTLSANSYGASFQLRYTLKVVGGQTTAIELPAPRLYLDGTEIPLAGTTQNIELNLLQRLKTEHTRTFIV